MPTAGNGKTPCSYHHCSAAVHQCFDRKRSGLATGWWCTMFPFRGASCSFLGSLPPKISYLSERHCIFSCPIISFKSHLLSNLVQHSKSSTRNPSPAYYLELSPPFPWERHFKVSCMFQWCCCRQWIWEHPALTLGCSWDMQTDAEWQSTGFQSHDIQVWRVLYLKLRTLMHSIIQNGFGRKYEIFYFKR